MKDLRQILSELYRSETRARHLPDHDDEIGLDGQPLGGSGGSDGGDSTTSETQATARRYGLI